MTLSTDGRSEPLAGFTYHAAKQSQSPLPCKITCKRIGYFAGQWSRTLIARWVAGAIERAHGGQSGNVIKP